MPETAVTNGADKAMQTLLPDLPPVSLDAFEGPLDVLLHLIRGQKLDIFDIPMAMITAQYLDIIKTHQKLDIDVAGEYLVMASSLIQLKSRMLLPRVEVDDDGNDIDPREALVAQLMAYEQYRLLAEELNEFPHMQRDMFKRLCFPEAEEAQRPLPEADLSALLAAFSQVMQRVGGEVRHKVEQESMSVREQMQWVTERLQAGSLQFHELLHGLRGREAWVTTLLAVLELWRQRIIQVIQEQHFSAITVFLTVSEQESGEIC